MSVDASRNTLAEQVSAIIRRHQAGDARAASDLFVCVTPRLLRIAFACRLSRHSAEDVVQSTMESVLGHLSMLRNPDRGLAWMSVIARREAIRVSGEERRTDPVAEVDTCGTAIDSEDPAHAAMVHLSREVVLRALATLPDRHRNLLQLLYLNGPLDYATIAQRLNMPLGSIGPTRQRGLRKVRELLIADRSWPDVRSA